MMKDEIKKACEIMQKGGVILYPTDTVWGIGCDATNEEAVKRVYEIKHRADSKAMLVLVSARLWAVRCLVIIFHLSRIQRLRHATDRDAR